MVYETEMLRDYEEYCKDCYYEGKTPKSIHEWLAGEE